MSDDSTSTSAAQRKGSFPQTVRAVAWSFFGVRKSSEHARDVDELNPVHVVIAGVLGAVIFVVAILLVVSWVVGSGGATR